ncbi:MAG: hypothetical protein B0W54_12600 [Cellvibrio sp. 79]|nr:MAG: hypothetical protein B0W54_12600 [Cellvibrio sp. 79]
MYEPKELGFWSNAKAPNCGSKHQFLISGKKYRVIKEFTDYDRHIHPEGEEWLFLGYSFAPYDDGLSWLISFDDKQEWHIPMQWRDDEQGKVLDALEQFIQEI